MERNSVNRRYAGSLICLIFFFFAPLVLTVTAQEQLSLAAIRVEFVEDQNDLTTGTGKFLLDGSGIVPYTIDPPPHNRSYFEDQILAVQNYFLAASRGQLTITGQVFPRAQDNAYLLPHEMAYYNPNTTETENDAGLAQLFVDAITVADQDPDLDFSQFDLVVIFHAGVGKDIDLGFDATPQDIPSLYISSQFLRRVLGDSFTGVPVNGGQTVINSGIILPETESQDDIQIALTGIFAANIGSHLGLYDLFSPAEEAPGIGSFGLMDVGLFNANGLLPALPCAFSRILAGWENPQEISDPAISLSLYNLTDSGSSGTTVYKIPLNSDEYYLLEYRGELSINIDSAFFEIANTRTEIPSYLEVLQTYIPDNIHVSDSTGVVLNIDNYDWGLPGAGILIWHIDESIIRSKGLNNQINDDPDMRAVDLEEADGSQDIGYSYSILEPGYQSEFGTFLDFWYAGNPSPLFTNEFSSTTSPNTRSNRDRAFTNIILRNFSDNRNEIMTFDFMREYYQRGFPLVLDSLKAEKKYSPLGSARINGAIGRLLYTSSETGEIYMLNSSGKGYPDSLSFRAAAFGRQEPVTIAFSDSNSDGQNDLLIAAGESGRIEVFSVTDADQDMRLDHITTFMTPDSVTSLPVTRYPFLYLATGSGAVYRYHLSTFQDTVLSFPGQVRGIAVSADYSVYTAESSEGVTVIDIDSDGLYDVVRWDGEDQLVISDAQGATKSSVNLRTTPLTSPVFSDVNQDGFYEIIYTSDRKIFVVTSEGIPLPDMPVDVPFGSDDQITGSPVISDVNGDNLPDLCFTTRIGQIYVYTMQGELIEGFPFTIGGMVSNTALLTDIDDDNQVELVALNSTASVSAWKLAANLTAKPAAWVQSSYNETNNRFITQRLNPVRENIESLLPSERVFNYPNPNTSDHTNIRYYLSDEARVSVKIFDLAGDLVTSFSGPGRGQSYNEIRWNVSSISSGVYICRVEAVSAKVKDVRLIKIMVVN